MKRFCSIVMISFCIIGFLNGVTPIMSDAADRGLTLLPNRDYCWNFVNTTLGVSGIARIRFVHIGGNHYLCSGVSTVTSPINMQVPFYGNAEIVAGNIYVTTSGAGVRNDVIGIDMTKTIVAPDTLNGTFESIGVYSDAVEISAGTFTYTPCQ